MPDKRDIANKKEKRFTILGERLNKLRGELSQAEFAKRVGLTAATVGYYENSQRLPDAETLYKICSACGCTSDYLLGIDEAHTRDVSDVCKVTPLAPETIDVFKLYKKEKDARAFLNNYTDTPMSTSELEIKTLNHIVSNCNAILTHIGIYLFGDIIDAENVKIKNTAINLKQPDEFIRNGILQAISYTLQNYRAKLLENGGDLPLTAVLQQTQEDREEYTIKARIEYLEGLWQRKLTEDEIIQQREQFAKEKRRE